MTGVPSQFEAFSLDNTDALLLRLLAENGRASVETLAKDAHISRAQAYRRIERLRAEGVIEGFGVRLNPRRLGLPVLAFVFARVRQPARARLEQLLAGLPGVEVCAWVTGDYDLVLVVRAQGIDQLRDEIVWPLSSEKTVRSTHTVVALHEDPRRPYVFPAVRT